VSEYGVRPALPFTVILHDTIDAVPRGAWDACAEGLVESWAYLRAVERSAIPGFELFYISVRAGDALLACAPAFVTDYPLETTVGGPLKTAVTATRRLWPRFLKPKLASLGSPVTEWAALAVAPTRSAEDRTALVGALIEGLMRRARERGAALLAIKDAPDAVVFVRTAAEMNGFAPMASLPEASIDLSAMTDEAGYWASLSKATRKDLRRKLKGGSAVRIERSRDLAPLAADIDRLYAATRARSDLQFEVLDHRYFQAVLDELGGDAALFLFRLDGAVIAFTLLIERGGVMIDKYYCADDRGAAFNLYFVSWIHHIRYAIARGVRRFEAGQSLYEPKLRLGCALEPTTIYFRHRHPVLNAALKLASRVFG
jgi:predicted N-acyltransferase